MLTARYASALFLLGSLHLLLICAKAPSSGVIFSGFFSLYVYGGLACRHRAFRLYLFAAAALLRRCFSVSAPKTADAFSSSKKDTASIAVRKQPSLYMYVTHPYRRNWLWEKFLFFNIMLKTQLIK